jgi:hypothetical protein
MATAVGILPCWLRSPSATEPTPFVPRAGASREAKGMVRISDTPVPVWVSVPPVSLPVFIGTRTDDPYGHGFYQYFTGASLSSLNPVSVTDEDETVFADITSERLLPFVAPAALKPFVRTAKLQALAFGLPCREHIILLYDDPTGRWWLYQPIAEVNRLVVDGEVLAARVVDSQIYVGDEPLTMPASSNRAVFSVPARMIEIHYAVGVASPVVYEALPYLVAAAYLKAAASEQSSIYDAIRVGAVSFSFKSAKDISAKSRELERIAYRMLRVGGRL